ncbi:MAG: GNAT family N-acetyltransferase [Patescibacteria group bacterium]|nr:GNAT family N-acetyltransferase [Patescibacteria group bacterium]
MITVKRESYAEVIDDIRPLLERHWKEIARNQEKIPLDPDYSRYQALDAKGMLFIFTAKDEGEFVGYAIYFIGPHVHYKSHKWAISDIFWVKPERRGVMIGKRLFTLAEQTLKEAGASVMHTTSKIAHPEASRLLVHLGHTLIEYGHAKLLLD